MYCEYMNVTKAGHGLGTLKIIKMLRALK